MRNLSTNQDQKEDLLNQNFTALNQASAFGWRIQTSTGLVFGYWGGNYQNSAGALFNIADGTITVTASTTNYVYLNTTTGVIANSTTVPATGFIRIAKVVTDATKITSVTDERIFALFPVGTANSLAGGGNKFVTQQDWEVTDVTGLVVTIRQGRFIFSNPIDYSSNFVQNINGTTAVTLPASSSGYIVTTSSTPYIGYVTTVASQSTNMLGVLYYFTTSSTGVTLLVECSRSNLPRLFNIYETSLALTGNLSKVNSFTVPWVTQNYVGNLSSSYRVEFYLRCLTAENGYAVGDLVQIITGTPMMAGISYPAMIKQSGTNGGTCSVILDAAVKTMNTTGQYVDVTPANWQIRCRVYAIR